jgi:hypothetical protein
MPVGEVCKRLDDPTLPDDAALATRRHTLKLSAQRREAPEPRVDLADLRGSQGMRLPAIGIGPVGEVEQCSDCLALEA